MKDFYFLRYKITKDLKKKAGSTGILVIEGVQWTDKSGKVVNEERYDIKGTEYKHPIETKN